MLEGTVDSSDNAAPRRGIDNDNATLRDVSLGRPDIYRWTDAGPLTRRILRNADKLGVKFDPRTAMAQRRELSE